MKQVFKLIPIVLSITSTACARESTCERFPKATQKPIEKIYALPDANMDENALLAAKKEIDMCYSKQPYSIKGYRIIHKQVKEINRDKYILTFELDGISDNRIAFIANEYGNILGVFEYSTL